jgi:RimJ/RimL family protein N-acetyltransferase
MTEQWITHPTILFGESVDLIPLEKQHFEELFIAASDAKLWEFIPLNCSVKETFEMAYNSALEERERGNQYPFVVYHKQTKELIGSTRFLEIFPKDLKLEIGWTWITQKYWATEINLECKLLQLTFAFEILKTRRVQIKTDENNIRSRKAIEKIGGKFEGILRKDKIRENGTSRNAAYFSIIDDEWEEVKKNLSTKLNEKRKALNL